jgi:hypothetical protein
VIAGMPTIGDPHHGRPYRRHVKATRARPDTDVCVRCLNYINKDLLWPHPDSWTLDHIPALADGGRLLDPAHSHGAHARCNSTAGAYLGNRRRNQPTPPATDESDW